MSCRLCRVTRRRTVLVTPVRLPSLGGHHHVVCGYGIAVTALTDPFPPSGGSLSTGPMGEARSPERCPGDSKSRVGTPEWGPGRQKPRRIGLAPVPRHPEVGRDERRGLAPLEHAGRERPCDRIAREACGGVTARAMTCHSSNRWSPVPSTCFSATTSTRPRSRRATQSWASGFEPLEEVTIE
jgi:hypothetical protein